MNIKEQLEISKIILQTISIGIPLLVVILSQFKGREMVMNQNKENGHVYLIISFDLYSLLY
ncbi:hypothetical protein J4710_11705 [Staphylococcus xylosus]|uniref:Uncharacterized protein n=1 Tax=Staphylococcus xylosus TaxID=1288 RepID=A0A939SK43_STAXY|nr:hypothetical protein [Staphylococcus xylosus]